MTTSTIWDRLEDIAILPSSGADEGSGPGEVTAGLERETPTRERRQAPDRAVQLRPGRGRGPRAGKSRQRPHGLSGEGSHTGGQPQPRTIRLSIRTDGPEAPHDVTSSCQASPMAMKRDLETWIVQALRDQGREMSVVDVARHVWEHHEVELRDSGDLFFTWQYDLRWAAQNLRNDGVLASKEGRRSGGWSLAMTA